MRIGSILLESIRKLERELQNAIDDKERTEKFIRSNQDSLGNQQLRIDGLRKAIQLLNEEANNI